MPPDRTSSQARLLAPVALVVLAVAVALIVVGSGGSGDGAATEKTTAGEQTAPATRTSRRRPPPTTYTVKPGDTLGAIGEKTGFDVDILQQLNPTLDPQTLNAGQKIKLPPK
jgi:LysM repeat protein